MLLSLLFLRPRLQTSGGQSVLLHSPLAISVGLCVVSRGFLCERRCRVVVEVLSFGLVVALLCIRSFVVQRIMPLLGGGRELGLGVLSLTGVCGGKLRVVGLFLVLGRWVLMCVCS